MGVGMRLMWGRMGTAKGVDPDDIIAVVLGRGGSGAHDTRVVGGLIGAGTGAGTINDVIDIGIKGGIGAGTIDIVGKDAIDIVWAPILGNSAIVGVGFGGAGVCAIVVFCKDIRASPKAINLLIASGVWPLKVK